MSKVQDFKRSDVRKRIKELPHLKAKVKVAQKQMKLVDEIVHSRFDVIPFKSKEN